MKHPLSVILVFLLFISLEGNSQVRFYLDYSSVPFQEGFQNNFKVLTGFKLDPNKEIVLGVGLIGRFNPEKLQGDLRFSQSDFSLGFNYYISRGFYLNSNVSLSLLNNVLNDVTSNPVNFDSGYYFNYNINAIFVVFRRLHFATGTSITNFSNLLIDVGDSLLQFKPVELNLVFSMRLYLFQIKT